MEGENDRRRESQEVTSLGDYVTRRRKEVDDVTSCDVTR